MTLYPRQQVVVEEAKKIISVYKMCYLAIIMRYGKSLIAAELTRDYSNPLIVTTKSAVEGVNKVLNSLGVEATVITYGSIHKINNITYDFIYLDESHTNISSFPKPGKAYEKLQLCINDNTVIVFGSGTPNIESSAQLFHQLSLSHYHSFHKFDSFYTWWYSDKHYKTKVGGGYGLEGHFKYTGGSRPAVDYSYVKDFSNRYEPMMIKRAHLDSLKGPKIVSEYISMPSGLRKLYHDLKTTSICTNNQITAVSNGGADKLNKLSQLAGGTIIDDEGTNCVLDNFKARAIYAQKAGKKICVFYKYIAHRSLLKTIFDEADLYQSDSQVSGIDLSHYDELVVYSMSWSGANISQMLARLTNSERTTTPIITFYLTKETVDQKTFETVMKKRDDNLFFLKD